VAAITSRIDEELYPTEVLLPRGQAGLAVDSLVLLNQIRSVDRRRLVKRLGRTDQEIMRRVDRALQISLGLLET
jgi:mRNA interferase MazF